MAKDESNDRTEYKGGALLSNESTSRVASIGLGLACTSLLTIVGLSAPFLRKFSGAPYFASATSARRVIISRLQLEAEKKGGGKLGEVYRIVDLGSGSGDVLIEAAQHLGQVRATGYELNMWLVLLSRWRAYRQGVASQVRFVWGDMWHAPLNTADAIIVFGIPAIMDKVACKITKDAQNDCLVASNSFQIVNWRPIEVKAGVWMYRVGVSDTSLETKSS